MIKTQLGKIKNIEFGIVHDMHPDLCLFLQIGGNDWGVDTTVFDLEKIKELLIKAKIYNISNLKNIPVEVTIEDNILKEWRILEEVL